MIESQKEEVIFIPQFKNYYVTGYFKYNNLKLVHFTKLPKNPIEYHYKESKSWINKLRTTSRNLYLKDRCEVCFNKDNLTIHHVVPLKYAANIEEQNCKTLCRKCHNIIEGFAKNRNAGFIFFNDVTKKQILKHRGLT